MKVLVTGSKGMLAHSLIPILREGHDVIPLSHQELDITNMDSVNKAIRGIAPGIVINCAAYTKVDKAEEERETAFIVNGIGVQNLAIGCADNSIPLCHVSTDYVFDGEKGRPYSPFDNTKPVNTYGASKLAGEKYVQWVLDKFYIVRTSWLYGQGGGNFVSTILKLAKDRPSLRIVKDQKGSPTSTVTLARGLKRLIESGAFGIYHITDESEGGISWFDFAREIISLSKIDATVIPIITDEYPRPARRPMFSVLDTEMTRLTLKMELPNWKKELKKYLGSAG
ncbi:MAG: dTDP-4-dehydrorhamnose reductase [Nitrospirae bacterium]|nr:dTDP-4-dehydrorhamnose reductase [Nitrospirota bacterium]